MISSAISISIQILSVIDILIVISRETGILIKILQYSIEIRSSMIDISIKYNLKIKRDLPSRCLIVILPRHQSGTKELHEKHAHAYLVSLKSGSVSRRKSRNEGEGGDNSTRAGHVTPSFLTDDEEELQSNIDLVSLV